jgi:SAM-dependent methyltransferase
VAAPPPTASETSAQAPSPSTKHSQIDRAATCTSTRCSPYTDSPWPTSASSSRIARRANRYERDGLAPLLLRLQHQALGHVELVAGDRLLEVGCATGAAVRAAVHQQVTAIGIDRSPAMTRHARRLAESSPAARFLVADATGLPYPARPFTAVLRTSVAHYLDDPEPALAEIARVLPPAGASSPAISTPMPGAHAPANARSLRRCSSSPAPSHCDHDVAGLSRQ